MDRILFSLGTTGVTLEMALLGGGALMLGLLALVVVVLLLEGRRRAAAAALEEHRRQEGERQLADLMRIQSEMTGRMQTMAEIFGARSADLARLVNDRLDAQGQRVGQAIESTNQHTTAQLAKMHERLAVIDRAQLNIAELSQSVGSLEAILANKQTRGAFGQGRMETILADGLPPNGFALQATLSNGRRPDALVFMPNAAPPLVIDAKFPLESWHRLGNAEGPEAAKQAAAGFRTDMGVHVRAIADSYLIPGETADTAFLFVPSESIFADLHAQFDDVVHKALRARVVIVSPAILMLSIQVVQALLRDVKMREEAHRIQREVREMLTDLGRLDERVRKLQAHFQQAKSDVADILVSTGKLTRRGERIEQMEFDEPVPDRLAGR